MHRIFVLSLIASSLLVCVRQGASAPPPEPARPKVLGVAHMAVYVKDLDKTRRFYEDFLGFAEPFTLPRKGGGGGVRIAFLKVNDRQYFEIFNEADRGEGQLNHISFYTESADRMYVYLKSRGIVRNALDYLPRKADDDCLTELRRLYERRNAEEARRDLAAWLGKWGSRYPRLCEWVEANIEETLTFYRMPQAHHKHMKSTNMLERLNEELKRRTLVVQIFPNVGSCLRLIRALAVEIHEDWIEATRYLNMDLLAERLKEQKREAGAAA